MKKSAPGRANEARLRRWRRAARELMREASSQMTSAHNGGKQAEHGQQGDGPVGEVAAGLQQQGRAWVGGRLGACVQGEDQPL